MYFLSIIVFCFLFLQTIGRPTRVLQDYDKDSKDNSYRDGDRGDADDYLHNEPKSSLKQFAGTDAVPKRELHDENSHDTNEELDHERNDKEYLENNEEDEADATNLSHDDVLIGNNYIKRTAPYSNGLISYLDHEIPQKIETNEYNENDKTEPSQRDQYLKHYNMMHNIERDVVNRDRRQIKNNYLNEPVGNDETSTQKNEFSGSEDEETAIRRHVKKLSKEELDELLHSLSDDKRALLKNIIDNCHQEYDSINKREITKKAGANEENSFVGNEQSDSGKIRGGSANLEAESSMAPSFQKQDNTKKVDTESMYSKSTESISSSEKSNEKNNVLDTIADKNIEVSANIDNVKSLEMESKISGTPDSDKGISKKENKREINSKSFIQSESIGEEPTNLRSSNDLYCSGNEEVSQLWNEESSLYNDNNNKYKRELYPNDLDSIKSLEESFPNTESQNNFKPGSNLAPLVRVKRNGPVKVLEKRDINVLSNLKVPYFSSAIENNDEGSDEGGEFQDDGFFDRGANFAKSDELNKQGHYISKDTGENDIKYCGNSQSTHLDKNKLGTDTVGLGSDTDVVLSGIEGVDDNMMYNSVTRIRRSGDTFDNLSREGETDKFKQENQNQLGPQNDVNELSEEYNNAARYQENEAFGSLPRNYEHDLGRYKRIRRLKSDNVSAIK